MQKIKRFRQRANRYGFTINNPFVTDDVKVIDRDNLTAEQRELLGKVAHDYSFLKQPEREQYFDFRIVEYEQKDNGQVVDRVVAERAFFKDYASAQEYFKAIGFVDYVCFQYERGAGGNKHLQGFMHFSRPMDFEAVRSVFPTMHLDKCIGKNYECRAYCMKEDTKIEGFDFFEHGVLIEERQRADISAFKEDLLNRAGILELFEKYPALTLNSLNKIPLLQQEILKGKFKNMTRELHVTYIYGVPDASKSTFVYRVLGYAPMEVGKIIDYKSGRFDDYENQDIILFDEFYGQIPLTAMNDLLDGQPRYLPARYKAFIVSNYPLGEQYRAERANGKQPSFNGFLRRINEIIHMPERNVYIWQKGQPAEQVKRTLDGQGAKYFINGEWA
jgi:hypothetical protein